MSAGDILAVVTILVNVGKDLHDRCVALKQVDSELLLLTTHLKVLSDVFEKLENDVILTNSLELVRTLDILKSIQRSYDKCAKALGVGSDGTTYATQKRARTAKGILVQFNLLVRIPGILDEIHDKGEQLQKVTSILSISFLSDARKQQRDSNRKDSLVPSTPKPTALPDNLLDLNLRTGLTSIDRMVESLMTECESLERQLQEITVYHDTSAIQEYEEQNPEGAAFWKDRFQQGQLYASTLRYETFYVSWARFIHEVEASFVLKMIPTAESEIGAGDFDYLRLQGGKYSINQNGTRHLPTIRPLWLPALRSALDPLQKGYVKPEDYFTLLQNRSLSETLRNLVFENAGLGTLVECERTITDFPLPGGMESAYTHIGWTSAQIVAIPTPSQLGIVTTRDTLALSRDADGACIGAPAQDVDVYVRYVQTGQIERKSLSTQIRPVKGLSIGALISIRHKLSPEESSWSNDFRIAEFKACRGGEYIITAFDNSRTIETRMVEFRTSLLKPSADYVVRPDDSSVCSATPKLDCMLLGPSRVFVYPPKVGEKVQIEYDGHWYDSRVTAVHGDEIEYVDWESAPEGEADGTRGSPIEDSPTKDDEYTSFSAEQLKQFGKGTRRVWCPWRRNLDDYRIRPYRRFHINDTVEAPVMYPDFRLHYHDIDSSHLYLPARIVDVRGDQYVIDFSPRFFAVNWWPGRRQQGEEIDKTPGSDIKLTNPYDANRVEVHMDLVRPYIEGPRPALGVQSAKPSGWSSFQGTHFSELEDLLEKSLWNDDRGYQRAGS